MAKKEDVIPPKIYFDSCVFIAHFASSQQHIIDSYGKETLDAIEHWINLMKSDEATILTSSIAITEIKPKIDQYIEVFDDLFKYKNLQLINVNKTIADYASEFRKHYINNPFKFHENDINGHRADLSTADSIHLATAVLYEANHFFTYDDGKSKDSETGRRTVPILRLGNKIANDALNISKPFGQPKLIYD